MNELMKLFRMFAKYPDSNIFYHEFRGALTVLFFLDLVSEEDFHRLAYNARYIHHGLGLRS